MNTSNDQVCAVRGLWINRQLVCVCIYIHQYRVAITKYQFPNGRFIRPKAYTNYY